MIEKLLIKNFQAHEKLAITFDPQITVIVGATDSGKSSVFRALRWALLNQPRGSSFVRDGATDVGVKVQIDGREVVRSRKGTENGYSLDDDNYTAFGVSVPPSIEEFLKVDDLNFQQQHDAPFWLSLSAGEVSRRLNEIVDLEIIDRSVSKVKSKIQTQKQLVETNLNQLKKERETLASYLWVEEAGCDLTDLAGEEAINLARSEDIHDLELKISKAKELKSTQEEKVNLFTFLSGFFLVVEKKLFFDERVEKLKGTLDSIKELTTLTSFSLISDDFDQMREQMEKMKELRKKATEMVRISEEVRALQEGAREIEIPDFTPQIDAIRVIVTKGKRLRSLIQEAQALQESAREIEIPDFSSYIDVATNSKKKCSRLSDLISEITFVSGKAENLVDQRGKLIYEIEELTQGLCPVCGGKYEEVCEK